MSEIVYIKEQNAKKEMEKDSEKNEIISSIVLVSGLLLICILLEIYGGILKDKGYTAEEAGGKSNLALAVSCISEGVFPWNLEDKKASDNGALEIGPDEEAGALDMEAPTKAEEAPVEVSHEKEEAAPTEPEKPSSEPPAEGGEAETLPPEPEKTEIAYGNTAAVIYENDESLGAFYTVEPSYFDDALFIGDSRTVGIYYYGKIDNAAFLAKEGMTIYNLMETSLTTSEDYENVAEALGDKSYGKIYLMVGINELGTGNAGYFRTHYEEVIEEIRLLQPKAAIIVQAIPHVSAAFEEDSAYIKNAVIDERNCALKAMCMEKGYTYLDVNCLFDDETGVLDANNTFDGCHLYAKCYMAWYEFFLNHGVQQVSDDAVKP